MLYVRRVYSARWNVFVFVFTWRLCSVRWSISHFCTTSSSSYFFSSFFFLFPSSDDLCEYTNSKAFFPVECGNLRCNQRLSHTCFVSILQVSLPNARRCDVRARSGWSNISSCCPRNHKRVKPTHMFCFGILWYHSPIFQQIKIQINNRSTCFV